MKPLYFLHIPKTAGTSLRAFIEMHYAPDLVTSSWMLEEFIRSPFSELRDKKVLLGHYGWYPISEYGFDPDIVTMLRDPVGRTVSHYHHVRRSETHPLNSRARELSLEAYLDDPLCAGDLANFQTYSIANDDLARDYYAVASSPLERMSMVAFRKALRRMMKFKFVGVVEDFVSSLSVLCDVMGWPAPHDFPSYNKGGDEGMLVPSHVVAKIARLTQLDQKLYDIARRRLADELALLTPERVEANYGAVFESRPRVARVLERFDRGLLGSNWLPRDRLENGSLACWTGPGRVARIDYRLEQDRDYLILFNAGVYLERSLESISLRVNGVGVALTLWRMGDAEGIFKGLLSRAVVSLNAAYTLFEFEVDECVCPFEVSEGENLDTRTVGIHFRWIDILPAGPDGLVAADSLSSEGAGGV